MTTSTGFATQPEPATNLFQAALDALPAHIAILDAAGTIVSVNAAWRGFGSDNELTLAEDGIGTNYLDACRCAVASGDEHATSIVTGMQDVISGLRESFVFEYPCHAPHERRWFAFRMSRLSIPGESRFLVSHENVTIQHLAEETARTSEARYQAVFSGVGDAILVTDERGNYLDANPAAEELLGYSRAELLAHAAPAIVAGARSWESKEINQFPDRVAWRNDLELVRRDGEIIPVEALATRAMLPQGTIYVSAIRDMSQHRKAEAAKVQFVDAMAHDLGGPLTVIRGQGQLLRRRLARGEVSLERLESALQAIDEACERARLLISDLTDVARLESDSPLDLNRAIVDLGTITETVVTSFEGTSSTVDLHMERTEEPVTGWWDENRIIRVLENLLANAIKYSPAGGKVAICVCREEVGMDAVGIVAISDDGVGIPADDLPHIFERFHRGRNVQGRIAGTGLGLWGSCRIVEQHGGSIDIDSVEGCGTTVTVRLPLSSSSV